MNRLLNHTALLAALSALGGCAFPTTPPAANELRAIAPDRVLAFRPGSLAADSVGRVVIIRDVGFGGSGCFYAVSIDGTLAARLDTGERVELAVPVGERILRAQRDPQGRGLCGLMASNWSQTETTLKAGHTKSFRLTLSGDGVPSLQRAD